MKSNVRLFLLIERTLLAAQWPEPTFNVQLRVGAPKTNIELSGQHVDSRIERTDDIKTAVMPRMLDTVYTVQAAWTDLSHLVARLWFDAVSS